MGRFENFISEFQKRGFTIVEVSVEERVINVVIDNISISMNSLDDLNYITDVDGYEWQLHDVRLDFTHADNVYMAVVYH